MQVNYRFFFKQAIFNVKCLCLGVKIDHNATVKYAATMKATCSVKFLRFNDKNISNTREHFEAYFMKINQLGLFFQINSKC
jgi:hypothetical protein